MRGMNKPSQSDMQAKLGISQAYASMILRGERTPPRSLAIRIFREFDWRHAVIADLTDEQIATLEQVDPWTPRSESAAA